MSRVSQDTKVKTEKTVVEVLDGFVSCQELKMCVFETKAR